MLLGGLCLTWLGGSTNCASIVEVIREERGEDEEGDEGGGRTRKRMMRKSWRPVKMFTLGLEEESFFGTRPAVMAKSGNTSPIVSVSGTGPSSYGIDWDYSFGTPPLPSAGWRTGLGVREGGFKYLSL